MFYCKKCNAELEEFDTKEEVILFDEKRVYLRAIYKCYECDTFYNVVATGEISDWRYEMEED